MSLELEFKNPKGPKTIYFGLKVVHWDHCIYYLGTWTLREGSIVEISTTTSPTHQEQSLFRPPVIPESSARGPGTKEKDATLQGERVGPTVVELQQPQLRKEGYSQQRRLLLYIITSETTECRTECRRSPG